MADKQLNDQTFTVARIKVEKRRSVIKRDGQYIYADKLWLAKISTPTYDKYTNAPTKKKLLKSVKQGGRMILFGFI